MSDTNPLFIVFGVGIESDKDIMMILYKFDTEKEMFIEREHPF